MSKATAINDAPASETTAAVDASPGSTDERTGSESVNDAGSTPAPGATGTASPAAASAAAVEVLPSPAPAAVDSPSGFERFKRFWLSEF